MGKSVGRLLWSLMNSGAAKPPEHFAIQSVHLSALSTPQFLILLWYINSLAEEAGKNMSSSSSEYAECSPC
jgi:hypothetical protein